MRRAQDRAQSARSRKNGARSATFKNSGARSATIESRALGALKLASEARNENVPAKRADFFSFSISEVIKDKARVGVVIRLVGSDCQVCSCRELSWNVDSFIFRIRRKLRASPFREFPSTLLSFSLWATLEDGPWICL